MKIDSRLFSLSDIVTEGSEWIFNVPIYQRLYVWREDQVLTLLNDLINAYERDDELFFLGGTLLVEQESEVGRKFDLIDGQQRFTTLWMLCYAWRRLLEPFLTVKVNNKLVPRLAFAIRPEVDRFLQALAFDASGAQIHAEDAPQRMRTALALMTSVFEKRKLPAHITDRDEYFSEVAKFVFERVQFVITTVPKETDLNKLFEVINNRGVQLQHHEILKARMLEHLTDADRGPYALLWEACAGMNDFIEQNLNALSAIPAHETTALHKKRELKRADVVLGRLRAIQMETGDQQARTIDAILGTPGETDTGDENAVDEANQGSWVRSIVGFPLFLQHTLRIWLFENDKRNDLPRILDRDLLSLFEEHFFQGPGDLPQNVRSFIELLWHLRVIFDEHVIKWADQGEDVVHLISRIRVSENKDKDKGYMSRSRDSDSHRGMSLLQSMLYHSQEITTYYWLTPFLHFAYKNRDGNADDYFKYLRHLDNNLLGSEAKDSLAVRTRQFMEDPWRSEPAIHQSALRNSDGLKFAHYWFYKLEFILWFGAAEQDERWKNFRFTAKNSIEHISPQTPTSRDENRVVEAMDCFGNLALVSRNVNSEYGNLPYNEKQTRFKNNNRSRIDSLKMDLIYRNDRWNDQAAFAHQEEMIRHMDVYYAC